MRIGRFPVWSHNGRWVVFASMSYNASTGYTVRVYMANRDGSGRRVIARAAHSDPCFDADWSRDDSKIAYTVGCDVDFTDLFVIKRDGSGLRRLAEGGYGRGAFYAIGPDWSPDGRTILVAGLSARGSGRWRLFLIDANGHGRRAIPGSSLELGPLLGRYTWSRDGGRIFFVDDHAGMPALFVIRREGTGRTRISPEGVRVITFDASPAAAVIAFEGGDGQRRSVYSINTDGSRLQTLADDGGRPSWSPDGRRILFIEGAEIAVMRADGSNHRNIGPSAIDSGEPMWVPLQHR
jgi:Tol biopolymer transport system component